MKTFLSVVLSAGILVFGWSPALADSPTLEFKADQVESALPPSKSQLDANQVDSKQIEAKDLTVSHSDLKPEVTLNFFPGRENNTQITIAPSAIVSSLQNADDRQISETSDGSHIYDIKIAPEGFKILGIIRATTSAPELAFDFSSSEAIELVELGDGRVNILGIDGYYFGTLTKPWATDANGNSLPTSFDVVKSQLIQKVTTSGDTAYPVIADPSWTYSTDIFMNSSLSYSYKKAATVTSQLKSCFNCYFPVSGASKTYPYPNQVMYLTIYAVTATLYAPVRVISVYTNGWRFRALPGHFDGAGSEIDFLFYNDSAGRLHLSVDAIIVNTYVWPASEINKTIAIQTWHNFYNNVD
ncbi:MAG: hypothetical protein RLZZ600_1335 [Actinomycetota bacterium]|jgi:hypothetical protein